MKKRTTSAFATPLWSTKLLPVSVRKIGGLHFPAASRQLMTPWPWRPPHPRAPFTTPGKTATHLHFSSRGRGTLASDIFVSSTNVTRESRRRCASLSVVSLASVVSVAFVVSLASSLAAAILVG